jgi:hypothetical protein
MNLRPDITELLHAGLTDRAIEAQLHVSHVTVARHRAALGLPKCKAGRKPQASLAQAFRDRTHPIEDGHLLWNGKYVNGTPCFRFDRQRYTARRAAFIIRHGREPVGRVTPGCDLSACVALDHVEDQPMRQRNRATYAAIFGATV